MSLILGLETSCDECSAAVIDTQNSPVFSVKGLSTHSQIALHRPYGGVVPEIASRNHLETVNEMVDEALRQAGIPLTDIDAIAVTNRPGLAGALLIGVSAAKSMAYVAKKPLVAVHHLEGHASSIFLSPSPLEKEALALPLCLAIVSGGHTNLYVVKTPPALWPLDFLNRSLVGRSRDDAAGEAFDKTAKTLGFPYPGGVWIDKEAAKGNPKAFSFPRALPQKTSLDFSFSGLKTAVALEVAKLKEKGDLDRNIPDLCASLQAAIIDALISKIEGACLTHGCRALAVVGGVAANSHLRKRLSEEWTRWGLISPPFFPHLSYCTDNAAMIAAAGAIRFMQGHAFRGEEFLTLNAIPNPEI